MNPKTLKLIHPLRSKELFRQTCERECDNIATLHAKHKPTASLSAIVPK